MQSKKESIFNDTRINIEKERKKERLITHIDEEEQK